MNNKSIDWVKLPATLDSPGYKKATDEFLFTFATAKKWLDPYIQDMQARLGSMGVVFYVPCQNPEQVEALLRDPADDRLPPLQGEGREGDGAILACPPIPLKDLAEILNREERTVQLLEEKGIIVRVSRGLYDRDKTIAGLWKAYKEAETGQGDAFNEEKVKELRVKRQEREAKLAERLGKLANVEQLIQAETAIQGEERNALLNMPKTMGPQMDMVSGTEAEVKLNEWVRQHLKSYSSRDNLLRIIKTAAAPGPQPEKQPRAKEKRRKGKKR
jgi:phage terminase Nu1 subunit (DNA packaging protein)